MSALESSVESLFPPATRSEWLRRAGDALGVEDPLAKLQRSLGEGICVEGLYFDRKGSARDGAAVGEAKWKVVAEHRVEGPTLWAASLEEAAAGGVDGHLLSLDETNAPGPEEWRVLVQAHPWIDAESTSPQVENASLRLDLSGADVGGCLGLDPAGWWAHGSLDREGFDSAMEESVKVAARGCEAAPRLRTFAVDTSVHHAAGADEALDLALILATALHYLRAMEERGIEVETAARRILFRLRVDSRFFLSIAKGRALRQLWSQVQRECGVEAPGCAVFARQAERSLSILDPWVNVLRGTAAAFAGALGGADLVSVSRYDLRLEEKSPHAARLARNTALILRDESHLGRVKDPAGGSYALEGMTADLARRAWEIFREIESLDSIAGVLESGWVAERIVAVRESRRRALRTRKEARTGVSEFALVDDPAEMQIPQESSWHLDSDFEALRRRSLDFRRRRGQRPRVKIVTLGPSSEFNARLIWTENLLAAAGIGADRSPEALEVSRIEALPEGPVVFCTSDARLEREGLAAVAALGSQDVHVAGRPPADEVLWRERGVRSWIHVGIDVVDWLEGLLMEMGGGE